MKFGCKGVDLTGLLGIINEDIATVLAVGGLVVVQSRV